MEQRHLQSTGTSPWDIVGVGMSVSVRGRHGRVVARHYQFACISFDNKPSDSLHWVPIARCLELKPDEVPQLVR